MRLRDITDNLYEVYRAGSDADWHGSSATKEFQSAITKRLAGKARIAFGTMHMRHIEGAGWWCFLAATDRFLPKIQRSLLDLAKQYDYDLTFTTEESFLDNTPHGSSMLSRAKDYIDLDGLRSKQPNVALLVVFVMPHKEQEEPTTGATYYHVTIDKNVLKTGLKPGSTLKYQNRLYLWKNLHDAEAFASMSHHAYDKVRYILQVTYHGAVYLDHEYKTDPTSAAMTDTAVYIKDSIPPEDIKLVKTYNPIG